MSEKRFTLMTKIEGGLATEDEARKQAMQFARGPGGDGATYYVVKLITGYKKDPSTASEVDLRLEAIKDT